MESGRSYPDQIYTYDSDLDPKFIPPQPKKIKKKLGLDLVQVNEKSKHQPKYRSNNNNNFTRNQNC